MKRWIWIPLSVIAILTALWAAGRLAEPDPFPPPPEASFAFAVLGDAPYYLWEDYQLQRVIGQINRTDLKWVLHVGDILWRPCTDSVFRSRLDSLQSIRHPVVYTPGDNEWTDCWERGSGGYSPLERLARLREVFYPDPTRSLGGRSIKLRPQSAETGRGEFVENALWTHAGVVSATVHITGTLNGMNAFPGRTPENDAEARRRTEAAAAWARQVFVVAADQDAAAVVLGFHANLNLDLPLDDPERQVLEPFVATLEEEAARFGGPVLLAQGGDHEYIVDRPLVDRRSGRTLENVTRLQVPGSPEVGWVRAVVTPGAANPFSFQSRTIPRWLVW